MRSALVVLLVASMALAVMSFEIEERELDINWREFLVKFNKHYRNPIEVIKRRAIFTLNVLMIKKHNEEMEEGKHTYKLDINEHADLTFDEFKARFTGILVKDVETLRASSFRAATQKDYTYNPNVKTPASFDWRNSNIVSSVKNQGSCGSCYSFAAVASVESQYLLKYSKSLDLSEQQAVDCSFKYGNQGCNGGLMTNTYEYYLNNGGIASESSYPYLTAEGTCSFDASQAVAQVTGYVNVKAGDEDALQQAIVNEGPVAVGIMALPSFQFYSSGVYQGGSLCQIGLNHAILAIGYGVSNVGQNYWIIKNSWGESWGQGGYGWMSKNNGNNCGIASLATFPTIA